MWRRSGTPFDVRRNGWRARSCPEEPEREQWPLCRSHCVHNVRRVVHQATDAGLVPGTARLTPVSLGQDDIDLFGRMTMVGILRMRRHEADADPDIATDLDPIRTGDRRVCMVGQERLGMRLRADADLPRKLWFD